MRLVSLLNLDTRLDKIDAVQGKSFYDTEEGSAVTANGTSWMTLFTKAVTYFTEIRSLNVTKGGSWTGKVRLRIVDEDSAKIFPFGAYATEDTEFFDTEEWDFPDPVTIPAGCGYTIQFCSDSASDGSGETLTLTEAAIIERRPA
ncbi:MAG: hypothetical protein PHE59_05195 [Patescibacteria group bacterium]|nr:hypothetical protein [Patescibacteria group bacterium]